MVRRRLRPAASGPVDVGDHRGPAQTQHHAIRAACLRRDGVRKRRQDAVLHRQSGPAVAEPAGLAGTATVAAAPATPRPPGRTAAASRTAGRATAADATRRGSPAAGGRPARTESRAATADTLRRRHHSPHRNHYRRPPPRPPPRPPHRRRLPRPCRCPHQSPCPRPGRHRSPKRRACPSLGSQPGQCRRRAQPPHSRRPWISPWDRAQPRGTPSHPGRALRPERSICRLRR